MVSPNFGLLQPNQSMQYFDYGMRLGQAARERQDANELRKAEATLFANPNDQNALAAYAQLNPGGAFKYRQQQQADAAAQQKAGQEKALFVAKLFDGVNDEQTYQQRLGIARRMGIDVSSAPPNFSPEWVAENGAMMRMFAEKPEALSTFGKIAMDEGFQPGTPEFNNRVKQLVVADGRRTVAVGPGGGVAVYNTQTDQTNFAILPNPGSGPTGAPAAPKGPPKPGDVIGGYRFKGGNPNDRNSWEKAGGASSNAGSSFRGAKINPIADLKQFGLTPTSGFRTQSHQNALVAQGLTKTRTGSHPRGDAIDFDVPQGMTKAQAIALVQQKYPGARAIPSNGNSIHVTFPGWGRAPDVSGSRRRYGD